MRKYTAVPLMAARPTPMWGILSDMGLLPDFYDAKADADLAAARLNWNVLKSSSKPGLPLYAGSSPAVAS